MPSPSLSLGVLKLQEEICLLRKYLP